VDHDVKVLEHQYRKIFLINYFENFSNLGIVISGPLLFTSLLVDWWYAVLQWWWVTLA